MVLRKVRTSLSRIEEIIEDTALALLSIFVILLAVAALAVFTTQAPAGVTERVAVIGAIASLGFLAKSEYFAALLLPWLLMIIGLLIARELWMVRRRLEGIHFEVVMQRLRTSPKAVKGRRR